MEPSSHPALLVQKLKRSTKQSHKFYVLGRVEDESKSTSKRL